MGHTEDFITILEVFESHWLILCKRIRVLRFVFQKLVPTGRRWKYFPVVFQGGLEGAIEICDWEGIVIVRAKNNGNLNYDGGDWDRKK